MGWSRRAIPLSWQGIKGQCVENKREEFLERERAREKKKVIVIRILPFRGICFWSGCYRHFPHLWILGTSNRRDLPSPVSLNFSFPLGLTREQCFLGASLLLGVLGGKARRPWRDSGELCDSRGSNAHLWAAVQRTPQLRFGCIFSFLLCSWLLIYCRILQTIGVSS